MSPNPTIEVQSEICKLAFDFAADPIFVLDIAGNFIEVNQAACDHIGYSREELLQMHPGDIDDPESRALLPGRFAQLKREGGATFESVHIHRSGRHIPVEMHIRLFERDGKNYILNICRDISERKLKEFEYQTIVQTTTDGFWIASARDARFLDVNEAYCRMVGYSRDELLSMHIFDLEAIESSEQTAAHIKMVMEFYRYLNNLSQHAWIYIFKHSYFGSFNIQFQKVNLLNIVLLAKTFQGCCFYLLNILLQSFFKY